MTARLPAGLDPATVAGMLPSAQHRSTRALDLVAGYLADRPADRPGYVSWSGGADSTVVVDLARQAHPGIPVVWFDSGLEFPETRTYIEALAGEWGLNLHIIAVVPDALSIMAASGAWDHTRAPNWEAPDLHHALVTVPARKAREAFGAHELWGLRAGESAVRRTLLAPGRGHYTRADGTRVFSPIWEWRDLDVTGHLASRGIPPNPVYGRLRALGASGKDLRVGLAFDANNLAFGRVTWLRRGWPEVYARIEAALPRAREWK